MAQLVTKYRILILITSVGIGPHVIRRNITITSWIALFSDVDMDELYDKRITCSSRSVCGSNGTYYIMHVVALLVPRQLFSSACE